MLASGLEACLKFFLRLFCAFVLIPGLVAALMWQLDRHGFFDVDRIELIVDDAPEQANYLKPLLARLDQSFEQFRGQSLWKVDLDRITTQMESESWVQSHSVSRRWPSSLSVRILPHEVKAVLLGKAQTYTPVIAGGRLLEPTDVKSLPDAILLEGEPFSSRLELRRKGVELISELPEKGVFSKHSISELRWTAKEGFIARLTRSGIEVKLGEGQIALKSARVSQVLEYLKNREMTPLWLDSNLSKKVLVRLKATEKSKTRFPDLPFAPPIPVHPIPMTPLSELVPESSPAIKVE